MIKCGAYEREITPALGLCIPGYFETRIAEDILDELMVKAVIFDDGKKVVGFAALDILHVRADMVKKIRDRFTQLTGVDGAGIMVSGTHAHTGQAVEKNDEFGLPDENWIDITCQRSADALVAAWKRRQDCVVGFGRGEEHKLSFNRRFWQKDGKVYTWPGRCNPDNVKEAAPVDPEVDVVRVDTIGGKPICVITGFANHLDLIGGCKYSADYPGELSNCIKQELGQGVVSLFLNGCCGDVTHIDYNTTEPYPADYYKTSGRALAKDVLGIYKTVNPVEIDSVDSVSAVKEISRRQPTKEMYEQAKRELDEYEAKKNAPKEETAEAYEKPTTGDADLMALSYSKCTVSLYENPILSEKPEVQVIRVGDIAFNAMPGEMFAELGLDLKARSKFARNINVELADGCFGYIATKKAFAEGGYEVTLDRYVNMSEDAGDIMVDTLLELQDSIKQNEH